MVDYIPLNEAELAEAKVSAEKGNFGMIQYYMQDLVERGNYDESIRFGEALIELGFSAGAQTIAEMLYAPDGATPHHLKWLRYMGIASNAPLCPHQNPAGSGSPGYATYQIAVSLSRAGNPYGSIQFLEKAVNQGFTEAAISLGFSYEYGEGVSVDYLMAARSFMRVLNMASPWDTFEISKKDWPAIPLIGWVEFERLDHYLENLTASQQHELVAITSEKLPVHILFPGLIDEYVDQHCRTSPDSAQRATNTLVAYFNQSIQTITNPEPIETLGAMKAGLCGENDLYMQSLVTEFLKFCSNNFLEAKYRREGLI